MDNLRLVNLESLAQFLEEALRAQPVRLSLTQRRSGQAPFITETWYLRLQGWLSNTDLGQLTQLFRVQLGPDGEPFHPQGRALRAALSEARELVRAYLEAQGYSVRGGFYAVPDELKPLDAQFECLEWNHDREAETVSVRLIAAATCATAEPAPPDEDDGGITLLPHRTAELEGLADAFADAEADFLGQFESAECPYCGEEAFVTPLGRVVCSCWTNPALEICEDIKAQRAQEAQKAANGGKP